MFGLRKALVISTLVLSVFASPTQSNHDDTLVDWDQLNAILDNIDSNTLHKVLHSLSPKFKDGVFSKDRSAIEHVHSENPIVASKLVHIAKRQSSNSTTTAAAVVTPSTPAETSSALEVSSSIASAISSQLASQLTETTVPPATTITVAPSAPVAATAVSTGKGFVVYSTAGGGVITLTSSAVGVRFTPSTSTHLFYTTNADGSVSTSTSLVVVNAPVTETAAATGAAAAASTSSDPGLRSDASKAVMAGFLAACAGAVGFIAAL